VKYHFLVQKLQYDGPGVMAAKNLVKVCEVHMTNKILLSYH